MTNIYKCPKCGSQMEEGFLIEHRQPLRWIAGKPEPSMLFGTKAEGVHRQMETYRCVGCGYLESYARALIT